MYVMVYGWRVLLRMLNEDLGCVMVWRVSKVCLMIWRVSKMCLMIWIVC